MDTNAPLDLAYARRPWPRCGDWVGMTDNLKQVSYIMATWVHHRRISDVQDVTLCIHVSVWRLVLVNQRSKIFNPPM